MSLLQKQRLSMAVTAAGIVAALASGGQGLWGAGGVLLLLAGLVLHGVLVRCPRCGAWLGSRSGGHCPVCGAEIDWEEPHPRA